MVKNTVQHHPDSIFMQHFYKLSELFVTAKIRVYMLIINCVVFMVRMSNKNRIQIQNIDSQIHKIINIFYYTAQISAKL